MRFSYKIKIICGFYLFLAFSVPLCAQELRIIKKNKTYRQQVQRDSLQIMIELKSLIPRLVYDLRYATTNNFTGEQLYATPNLTCLRLQPAKALKEVQADLNRMG